MPYKQPDYLFNYVALENIESGTGRIIGLEVTPGASIKSNKFHFTDQHVLYGKLRPYLKKVVAPDFEGISATDLVPLKPNLQILNRHFLMWWLLSPTVLSYVVAKQTGVKMPRLRTVDLEQLSIPLPPIAEQHRIVTQIDALFTELRAAREALDALPTLLKQFRQSILAAAFRGELTERNPDDEPASVLIERIRAERRARWEADLRAKGKDLDKYTYEEPAAPDTEGLPELPEGWAWVNFESIITELKNGYFFGRPSLEPFGVPTLRISAVRPGKIDLNDRRYVDSAWQEVSDYQLKNNDLLFTRYNGSLDLLGICALVRQVDEQIIYPDKLIRVRLTDNTVRPDYIEFYFATGVPRSFIEQKSKSSAGQQGISGKDLKAIPVALAPVDIQGNMVETLNSMFADHEHLRESFELASHQLDTLEQSILAQAFRGELVPQDPSDEPASVLLEWIRQTRADAPPRKTQRRKKE